MKDEDGYVTKTFAVVTFQASQGQGDLERKSLPLFLIQAVKVHNLQCISSDKDVIDCGKKNSSKQLYKAHRLANRECIV